MTELIIETEKVEHTKTFQEMLFIAQDRIETCLISSFPEIGINNKGLPLKNKIEKFNELSKNQEEGDHDQLKEDSDRITIQTIETAAKHTHSAENEYKNKNTESAWSLLCQAILLIGDLQSEEPFEKEKYLFERARSGGNARSAKIQPAKDKAIELLRTKKPENGWSSKVEASTAIVDELTKFVKEKNIALAPYNLINTLRRWLREDQQLIAAFDETKKN